MPEVLRQAASAAALDESVGLLERPFPAAHYAEGDRTLARQIIRPPTIRFPKPHAPHMRRAKR